MISEVPLPEAPTLPQSLSSPKRAETQYSNVLHQSGKRRGEKRRLDFDSQESQPMTSSTASMPPTIHPKASSIPILMVVPSQPVARSVTLQGPSTSAAFKLQTAPPPPPKPTRFLPHPSTKPCAACHVPRCGGLRKRYTPSKDKTQGSKQKIFTFCPTTRKSTTQGFDEVYEDYDHFKRVVDEELAKRKST